MVLFSSLEHIFTTIKTKFKIFIFFFFFFFLHFPMGVCGIFRPAVQGFQWIDFKIFIISSMILYNQSSYFKSGEINGVDFYKFHTSIMWPHFHIGRLCRSFRNVDLFKTTGFLIVHCVHFIFEFLNEMDSPIVNTKVVQVRLFVVFNYFKARVINWFCKLISFNNTTLRLLSWVFNTYRVCYVWCNF